MYIENPKTKGSGILCCIPQTGSCPVGCADCFFQSGRSYLEPLKDNLPNMPDIDDVLKNHSIVRVNDGNDSNNNRDLVISSTQPYPLKFYNTSNRWELEKYDAPVVLTLNPGKLTNDYFHKLDPMPNNLMFVKFRVNTWNLETACAAIDYYTCKNIPVVLTFMAYFNTAEDTIPLEHRPNYIYRKRTTNSYWAITTEAWLEVMSNWRSDKLVYSCGHIEGEKGDTKCKYCGNCLREFYATRVRKMLET